MKIEAQTFEEFFENSGIHKETLMQIDMLIMRLSPQIDRKLYDMGTQCGIGYAALPYKGNKRLGGIWPTIGIAPQKNTANLYVMTAPFDGKYLPELYAGKLGKFSTGKSCIRIKKYDSVNIIELENLLNQALQWHKEQTERQ